MMNQGPLQIVPFLWTQWVTFNEPQAIFQPLSLNGDYKTYLLLQGCHKEYNMTHENCEKPQWLLV